MIKQTRQLQQLVESALKTHQSIRGLVDINGVQIYFKLRKGLKPLLTKKIIPLVEEQAEKFVTG